MRPLLTVGLLALLSCCPADAKEGRGNRRSLQVAEVRLHPPTARSDRQNAKPPPASRPHTTVSTQPHTVHSTLWYFHKLSGHSRPPQTGVLGQGCLDRNNGPLQTIHLSAPGPRLTSPLGRRHGLFPCLYPMQCLGHHHRHRRWLLRQARQNRRQH